MIKQAPRSRVGRPDLNTSKTAEEIYASYDECIEKQNLKKGIRAQVTQWRKVKMVNYN